MSGRLRILIFSLGLVVLTILILAAYASAPYETAPAVSFTVHRLTNYMGKIVVIGVTNHESWALSLAEWQIQLEGPQEYNGRPSWPTATNLPSHGGCLLSLEFPYPIWRGPPGGRRWRVVCIARHNTWFHSLRMRAVKLPRIGRWITQPPDYRLASEFFPP